MDKYSILREFADSWGLLAMLLFFLGVILFAFRPGSRATYENVANIPLRNGDTLETTPDNETKGAQQPQKGVRS